MKTALLDLFAAAADGAAVHVGHGLEQSRVKLDGIFCFRQSEFRNRRVELQLQTLQNNRVKNPAFRTLPAQDAVSQDQLDALRLAVDTAIKRIKGLEEAHRLARGLFGASPLVTQRCPAAKSGQSRRIRRKLYRQFFAVPLRLFAALDNARQVERIVPARLEPGNNFAGRLRRRRQMGPRHTQRKGSVGGFRLTIGTLCLAGAGPSRALLHSRMHGQVVEPEMPGLFFDLALGRIAVLVQRLKISENAGNLFASRAKLLSIHKFSTAECQSWDGQAGAPG